MILYVWLAVVGRTDGWVGHFDVSFIICLLLKENRIGYLVFVLVVMHCVLLREGNASCWRISAVSAGPPGPRKRTNV